MKKSMWWVCSAVALALALSPAMVDRAAAAGEEGGGKKVKKAGDGGKKAKSDLKGEYAIMVSVLGLDEAQQAKLKEVVEKNAAALKAWDDSDNGKKLAALQEEAKKAREAKDKEKTKTIGDQMKALQKERTDLQASQQAAIQALLTDEQKAKWKGFVLYRSVVGRYKKLGLTEAQDKQVRDLCMEASKTMPGPEDRKAQGEAVTKLASEIEQKVLTDPQREELKKAPVKAPKGDGEKPKVKAEGK